MERELIKQISLLSGIDVKTVKTIIGTYENVNKLKSKKENEFNTIKHKKYIVNVISEKVISSGAIC